MPRRTNTIKVTDQKKPWNRKTKPSKYIVKIEKKAIILIVCEGQSEEFYFSNFPVLTLEVRPVNTHGQSKLQLVEITREIVNEVNPDFTWCVFDMDSNNEGKEKSDYDNAIKRANDLGYNVAYSNDCFDLWFYLHYEYTDQSNHRKFYYKELSRIWDFNYENDGKSYKFCKGVYNVLNQKEENEKRAIASAEKLHNMYQNLPFHKQNPVTTVYQLVNFLRQHCRE